MTADCRCAVVQSSLAKQSKAVWRLPLIFGNRRRVWRYFAIWQTFQLFLSQMSDNFKSSLIYIWSKSDIFQRILCFMSQIFGNRIRVWRSFPPDKPIKYSKTRLRNGRKRHSLPQVRNLIYRLLESNLTIELGRLIAVYHIVNHVGGCS